MQPHDTPSCSRKLAETFGEGGTMDQQNQYSPINYHS